MRKRDRHRSKQQQKRFHAERRAATKRKEDAKLVDNAGWLRAANSFNKSLWEDDDFDDRELFDLGLLNAHIYKIPLAVSEAMDAGGLTDEEWEARND